VSESPPTSTASSSRASSSRSTTTAWPRSGDRTTRCSRCRSTRFAFHSDSCPGSSSFSRSARPAGAALFSVASAPGDRRLEVAIKAVGDYTRQLRDEIRPGDAAKVAGPFGGFDYRRGGKEQVWIAGGIGITPFLSWIRSLDAGFDRDVVFYYSVAHEGEALYLDEIERAAKEHPNFVPHVVVADRDGFLTAKKATTGRNLADVWVYMCGPPPMTKAFSNGFRSLGVPRSRLRWEEFAAR
jgi:predicted ferric reductase